MVNKEKCCKTAKKIIILSILCAFLGNTYAQKPAYTDPVPKSGFPRKAINFNTNKTLIAPNAWGIFKDTDGNRYGFHKNYDVYKVATDGTTTLYFSGKENNVPIVAEGVMDKEGNFYFPCMATNGQRIIKLTKKGELIQFGNGNTFNVFADGKGESSKIFKIYDNRLKCLADGNIYFTEYVSNETKIEGYTGEIKNDRQYNVIRKLTPDGELSTLKDKNNNIFFCNLMPDFTMDKDGNIIFAGGFIYKLKPGVEITKLVGATEKGTGFSLPKWTMGDVSKAIIPDPDKLFYNNKNELIIWSYTIKRFAKFDGKTVSSFSGTSDMNCYNSKKCRTVVVKEDIDGNANTAQYYDVKNIVVDSDAIYITTYNVDDLRYSDRILNVRKISSDGSVKTIFKNNTSNKL